MCFSTFSRPGCYRGLSNLTGPSVKKGMKSLESKLAEYCKRRVTAEKGLETLLFECIFFRWNKKKPLPNCLILLCLEYV